MELYQIRYFLAVADTLNFTRASKRSFISQPALTKAIQRLEETVGGRLFERTKNSVQLTELGREMLPNLRQIYDSVTHAREQARRLMRERKEVVRVGVMCTIDLHGVLPSLTELLHDCSEIAVSFFDGNFEALSDALDQGDVDISIMASPNQVPGRFKAVPLFSEDYALSIGDAHRFNGRGHVDVSELHRERYCQRVYCEYSSYIEELLRGRGVALDVVHKSTREDWVQAFVRANSGVAFMPVSTAKAVSLARVGINDLPIAREVIVLMHVERPITKAQQMVIDSLIAHKWTYFTSA